MIERKCWMFTFFLKDEIIEPHGCENSNRRHSRNFPWLLAFEALVDSIFGGNANKIDHVHGARCLLTRPVIVNPLISIKI
jgi:hypothetical protein